MDYTMLKKIRSQGMVKVFSTIICMEDLDFGLKLGLDHGMEVDKYSPNFSFIT